MWWAFAFVVVVAVTAIGLWVRAKWHRPVPESKPQPLLYGHPCPPAESLRGKLPTAPEGHVWEIKVISDESSGHGHLWMHLTLVQVATEQNVDTTKTDLTVHRKHIYPDMNKTWADEYRRYPSLAKEAFWKDLIGPLVDWAQLTVNKFSPGITYEYKLG